MIWPVPPLVPVLGAIANHQERTTILCGYDQLVQETEGERVVPMKILEYGDDGLYAALAQQQSHDRLIRQLPALDCVEGPQRIALFRSVRDELRAYMRVFDAATKA